jgi:hypothetical protein
VFRIRTDLSWEDVVNSSIEESKKLLDGTPSPPSFCTYFSLTNPLLPSISPFLHFSIPLLSFHLPVYSHKVGGVAIKQPQRHWRTKRWHKLRSLLENFAKNKGMDPLLPGTWYKIPCSSIMKIKVLYFIIFYNMLFI